MEKKKKLNPIDNPIRITCKGASTLPLSELIAFQGGLKKLSNENRDKLLASICTEGFMAPIFVWKKDNENNILDGTQRTAVLNYMEKNGWEIPDLPVVFISAADQNEARRKLLKISSQYGEFDMDELESWINDFDEDITDQIRLADEELDIKFKEEEEETTGDDDINEDVEPITQLGDLWELGEHRLLCGDSTSKEQVEYLMDGQKADMVFTDPPYNIDFKPQRGTFGKIKNDNMSDDNFYKFLDSVFRICKDTLNPNTYLISFMGWSTISSFKTAIEDKFKIKSMPVWVKNNFGIGYYTRPKYEPFFLCLNGDPVKPDKAPADVFEFAKVNKTIHSCEKPIDMIIGVIDYFNRNGLFYEPFAGSGSLLIACEKTNRKHYGLELDPHYCDVIVNRYITWCKENNHEYSVKLNGEDYIFPTKED